LAREERDQHRRQHQRKRGDCEHERLRPQDGEALRHRSERGADHAGRVLAGDHEDAEHADGELCDLRADQADIHRVEVRALGGTALTPVRGDHGGGKDRKSDREDRRREQ
jgi:hypothetical protein